MWAVSMSLLFLLLPVTLFAARVLDGELFRFDFSELTGTVANDKVSGNLIGNLILTPGVTWSSRSVGLNFTLDRTQGLTSSKNIDDLISNITSAGSYFTLEIWVELKPSSPNFEIYREVLSLGMPIVDASQCNGHGQLMDFRLHERRYALNAEALGGTCKTISNSYTSIVQQKIRYFAFSYALDTDVDLVEVAADSNPHNFDLVSLNLTSYNSSYNLQVGPSFPTLASLIPFEGIIYQISMYNRGLTSLELNQNFDAWIANSPPYAQNATVRVYENLKQIIPLTYYDFDIANGRQNETITYTLQSIPAKGRMFLNGSSIQLTTTMLPLVLNNSIQYIGGLNEYGDNYASFSFSANDGYRAGPIAWIQIDVEFVNQPPVPLPAEYEVYEEYTMLQLNGTDVENGTYIPIAVITRLPMNGILYQSDGENYTVPITNISDPYDCLVWANRSNITCEPNGQVLDPNLTLFYLPINFNDPSSGNRVIGTDNFAFIVADGTNFSLAEAEVYIDILNPLQSMNFNVSQYQERRGSHKFPGSSRFGDPYAVIITSPPIHGQLFQYNSTTPISNFPVTLNAPNGSQDIVDYVPFDGEWGKDPPLERITYYLQATNKPFRSADSSMNISVIPINHPPTLVGNNTARVVPMLTDQPIRLTLSDQDVTVEEFTFNLTSLHGICKVKPYPKVVKYLKFIEGDGDYAFSNVYNGSQQFATLSVLRFYYRCFAVGSDVIFVNLSDNGGFPITPAYDVQWTINITSYKDVIALPSTVQESPEMVVAWVITGFVPIACLCCIAYKQCNNRYRGYKPQPEGADEGGPERVELDSLQSPVSSPRSARDDDLHDPVVRDPTVISREPEGSTTRAPPTNGHTLSHAASPSVSPPASHAPPPRAEGVPPRAEGVPSRGESESTTEHKPMMLQLPIGGHMLRPAGASTASTAPVSRPPPITPRGRGATTSSQAGTAAPPVSSRDRGDTTSSTAPTHHASISTSVPVTASAHSVPPPSPRVAGPPPSPRPVTVAPPAPPPRAVPTKSSWRRYSTDDGTGRYYFYNKETNESVWVQPADFDPERDVDSDQE